MQYETRYNSKTVKNTAFKKQEIRKENVPLFFYPKLAHCYRVNTAKY